jgi:hypothetical protein
MLRIHKDSEGTTKWYKGDNLHREGGPAIETPNSHGLYFLNGVQYEPSEYKKIMRNKKLDSIL